MIVWRMIFWKIRKLLSWPFKKRQIIPVAVLLILVLLSIMAAFLYTFNGPSCASCPKYVNVNKFTFVTNNETICPLEDGTLAPLLVTIINSARHHFEYRQKIRETWGSLSSFRKWNLRRVFLIGIENENTLENEIYWNGPKNLLNRSIEEEIHQYGDVVMGNFYDSYHNMTIKHLMAYKWILNYCPQATVVLKTDDDMFVDMFQLINYLQDESPMSTNISCHRWETEPKYYSFDKWRISRDEFDGDKYPPFCLGAAYLTTPRIMKSLFSYHSFVRYFWIDDIFVTGVLRVQFNNAIGASGNSPNTIIEIDDVQDLFSIESSTYWNREKIFYLLKKTGDTIEFERMDTLWELSEAFKDHKRRKTEKKGVVGSNAKIVSHASSTFSVNIALMVIMWFMSMNTVRIYIELFNPLKNK